jgi:hypothetical protein
MKLGGASSIELGRELEGEEEKLSGRLRLQVSVNSCNLYTEQASYNWSPNPRGNSSDLLKLGGRLFFLSLLLPPASSCIFFPTTTG